MNIRLTRIYAVLIGALAILGLSVNGHLFQLMNADIALDVLRVIVAGYLVYVGFIAHNERMASTALTIVGALYIVMGLAGLFSPTLGGLLPSGLTGFDIAFHLITGFIATGAAMRYADRSTHHMSHA
jgi:uncharacterized membrane protein